MIRTIILIIMFGLGCISSYCQQADSLVYKKQVDSIYPKPRLHSKSFIVPAVFVTYGALSLSNGPLKNLNYSTRNELKEDHPFFKSSIDNYTQYLPAAVVFGLNISGVKGRNSLKDEAIIYAAAMGINAAVVYPIKKFTAQMRPDGSEANSFPSGHTSTAFVAAEFLRKEYSQVSPWYGIGGYVVATGTGVFRLLNNKHWLGDVVAGAGIGIASTQLAYFIHDRIKWKKTFLKNSVLTPYYQDGNFGLNFFKILITLPNL